MYYLWYDNGTGHFDCCSKHDTLEEAIAAAQAGMKAPQHVTWLASGPRVWQNYERVTESGRVAVNPGVP